MIPNRSSSGVRNARRGPVRLSNNEFQKTDDPNAQARLSAMFLKARVIALFWNHSLKLNMMKRHIRKKLSQLIPSSRFLGRIRRTSLPPADFAQSAAWKQSTITRTSSMNRLKRSIFETDQRTGWLCGFVETTRRMRRLAIGRTNAGWLAGFAL